MANDVMFCSSLVPEHRAEGGGGELEAGAPGETAASGQGPVSSLHILYNFIPLKYRLSYGNQVFTCWSMVKS